MAHVKFQSERRVKLVGVAMMEQVDQKSMGAYYTPPSLAEFVASWAIRGALDQVVEPACGEAVFMLAAARRLRDLGAEPDVVATGITGYDIDPMAAQSARRVLLESLGSNPQVVAGDFFAQPIPNEAARFDAAIGNPPWVRYHLFDGEARELARRVATTGGVTISGLASSWAAFVVHAASFLKPEGRLGFVLPAELMTTDYAEPVRQFLRSRFASVRVITFDERVFPGALVDAVLLLAEGKGPGQVEVVQLRDATGLKGAGLEPARSDDGSGKWSRLLVPREAVIAYDAAGLLPGVSRLGQRMRVDIGVVTGANSYFVISAEDRRMKQLHGVTRRLVARPGQLRGLALTAADWKTLDKEGESVWLFSPEADRGAAAKYIREGVERGVPNGYKCRVRGPRWWRVRPVREPDFFLSYMSHRYPRFSANPTGADSSNLVHRVTAVDTLTYDRTVYAALFYNSLTLLSAEMEGRSYGGGVLKLETKEAERLLLPHDLHSDVLSELAKRTDLIDAALRASNVEAALDLVDPIVLGKGLGLTADDCRSLRSGWEAMRNRREVRGRSRP